VVTDPRHALFGNRFAVLSERSGRGPAYLVVELPDGRRRSIRITSTDPAQAAITSGPKAAGLPPISARVRKSYSAPTTPHQRLAADPHTSDAVRARLQEICVSLDPVALLRDIRSAQQRLADLANVKSAGDSITAAQRIDLFLASLRTAWKEGASRPTDRPILKAKRGRRRPDPLVQAPHSCRSGSRPSRGEPAPSS